MRLLWIPLTLFFLIPLAACASAGDSPITPAPDRPTFLYFYTDG